MYTVLVVIQVLVAVALISFVLIQHGKGADAGAAFGNGASGTVFGSRGSANFLSRTTGVLAAVFFIVSLALAYLVHGRTASGSVADELAQPAAGAPAAASSVAAPQVVVPDAAPKVQVPDATAPAAPAATTPATAAPEAAKPASPAAN